MNIIDLVNEIADRGSFSFTKDTDPIKRRVMNKLEALGLVNLTGRNKYRLSQAGYLIHEKGTYEEPGNDDGLNDKPKTERMKKVFISHSSLDIHIVEKVIDILEAAGVPSSQIFCSSLEGYGIRLGSDFLNVIKEELNDDVMVLFVLSNNFYSSIVSLCEMGATWVKTSEHIPILIPPFDYNDVKGVIPTTQGMKINEKDKLNSLKDFVVDFLGIEIVNTSIWEKKRDKVLQEIKKILDSTVTKTKNNSPETTVNSAKTSDNDDYYESLNGTIKIMAMEEWPDNFEMQLDHIERQKRAVENLIAHTPIDIALENFKRIRKNGRSEWPKNFEMQLDYEQRQVESLRRLNEL